MNPKRKQRLYMVLLLVLGIGTSAGSLGQVVFSPISQLVIAEYGWDSALFSCSYEAGHRSG